MIEYKLLTRADFEQHIEPILQLFRLRFTAPVKREDFIWRYLQSPFEDVNAVIAADGEKVVGFIGTMPNVIVASGVEVKSAMITNSMTHPEYTGKGIFSKLLTLLETKMLEKGYQFLYTFPNYQSNHILIDRHGWKDIYEIPRLELSSTSLVTTVDIETVVSDSAFALKGKDTYLSFADKYMQHSTDYRRWRMCDNTAAEYDNYVIISDGCIADAYITVRKYNDEYNIVDFAFDSIEQAKTLLSKVVQEFQATNRRILTAWCATNTKLHTLYERMGFMNRYPIMYFAGKCLTTETQNLLNWSGWCVQPIDDNIY